MHRNGEIGAFKYVGGKDRALKLCPEDILLSSQQIVIWKSSSLCDPSLHSTRNFFDVSVCPCDVFLHCHFMPTLVIIPISTKPISGRKKKKNLGYFIRTFMLEREIWSRFL